MTPERLEEIKEVIAHLRDGWLLDASDVLLIIEELLAEIGRLKQMWINYAIHRESTAAFNAGRRYQRERGDE